MKGKAMTDQVLAVRCPHCHADARVTVADAARGPVLCPNPECRKAFQVAVPAQPVAAPPAAQPAAAPSPAPVTAPGPSHQEAPESEVARVHLQLARRYPGRFLAYLGSIAGLIVFAFWMLSTGWTFWAIVSGAVAALLAWRLLAWWLRMSSTTVTITTKRCIVETGALTKESTEVLRSHIADLEVRQNMLMRLLNVGDLVITSSNAGGRKVVLMAVPHPELLADQLRVNAA